MNAIHQNINRLKSLQNMPSTQYGNAHNCIIDSCLRKRDVPRKPKINFYSKMRVSRDTDKATYLSGMALYCKFCDERHYSWRVNAKNKMVCEECRRKRSHIPKIDKILRSSEKRAKKKGIAHTLVSKDIEALLEQQGHSCSISRVPFVDDNYSIDRIDSSGGYTRDNIQMTTIMVNMMKYTYSQHDFIEMCKAIARNN